MKAILACALLGIPLAYLAYNYAKKEGGRGLVLIGISLFASADVWIARSPRILAALEHGGRLASIGIVTVLGHKVGTVDVVFSLVMIATIAAIANWKLTALMVGGQVLAFITGLALAGLIGPLPGLVFVALFSLPFIYWTREKWNEMPSSDRKTVVWICAICSLIAVVGIIRILAVPA